MTRHAADIAQAAADYHSKARHNILVYERERWRHPGQDVFAEAGRAAA